MLRPLIPSKNLARRVAMFLVKPSGLWHPLARLDFESRELMLFSSSLQSKQNRQSHRRHLCPLRCLATARAASSRHDIHSLDLSLPRQALIGKWSETAAAYGLIVVVVCYEEDCHVGGVGLDAGTDGAERADFCLLGVTQ